MSSLYLVEIPKFIICHRLLDTKYSIDLSFFRERKISLFRWGKKENATAFIGWVDVVGVARIRCQCQSIERNKSHVIQPPGKIMGSTQIDRHVISFVLIKFQPSIEITYASFFFFFQSLSIGETPIS